MSMEYIVKAGAGSHTVACVADGATSQTLCGRWSPSAHGFRRETRRPYRVCSQCQRALRRRLRRDSKVAAP